MLSLNEGTFWQIDVAKVLNSVELMLTAILFGKKPSAQQPH